MCSIILLSGCNKANDTKCTSEGKTDLMKINQEYKITSDGDKITKVIVKKIYEFSDSKDYDNFKLVINGAKNNNEDIDGISIKTKSKHKKHTIKTEYELTKLNDEKIKELGFNRSLKEYIKVLKNQGLNCK